MGWINVYGMQWPQAGDSNMSTTTNVTLDATGELIAWCGQVWTPNGGSKNIQKVGFRWASGGVNAGGSAATLSLQNVSTTTGPPIQPDGTPDQTVAVPISTSSGWYMTANLSSTRTVSYGEMVAAVLEFDGAGRLGADQMIIENLAGSGSNQRWGNAGVSSYLASVWAAVSCTPSILLSFDDGTYGTIGYGTIPFASRSTITYNNTDAADENSMRFRPPMPLKIEGIWMYISVVNSSSDFDVVVYEDEVAISTTSYDANQVEINNSARIFRFPLPEITLWPGRVYDFAIKPTTVNDVTLYAVNVDDATHLQAIRGGEYFTRASRVDGGAWSETTTRHINGGLLISAIPDFAPSALINGGGLVG